VKLVKTASGTQIKMSKKEWEEIGKKAGWVKSAKSNKTTKEAGVANNHDDELWKLMSMIMDMPLEQANPILSKAWGYNLYAIARQFLLEKLEKYDKHSPEEREEYAEKLKQYIDESNAIYDSL
jgi:hypothetical protein